MATPQAIPCISIDADLQSLLTNLPEFDWSSTGNLSPLSSLPPSPSPAPSPLILPQDPSHVPTTFKLTPQTSADHPDQTAAPSDSNDGQKGRWHHQNKRSHARRKATQEKVKASKKLKDLTARPQAHRKYVKVSMVINVDMDASDFPTSLSGYIAMGDCSSRQVFKIQDLVGPQSKHGLRLVDWDGMCVCFSCCVHPPY